MLGGLTAGLVALVSGCSGSVTSDALTVEVEGKIATFTWTGEITSPMKAAIQSAFRNLDPEVEQVVLVLNSPGGSVAEGDDVIRLLKRQANAYTVVTYVPDEAICASMCVPVFMGGEERVSGPHARFMFHHAYSVDRVSGQSFSTGTAVDAALNASVFHKYIRRSDLNPDFVAELESTIARDGEVWATGRDLHRARVGLIDRVSSEPVRSTPHGIK
ncbi:MAG: ATP-dependent Clp protease proteolytic subunit [Pseudomonadota bacterium]